ncbi:MAG TPA: oligosaccharide flippase family protein [Myxococcota bacterium]|nr:oligosaccharide flippase family protein [Myxococcota bacterium]
MWAIFSRGGGFALRFGSNLILTRLLAPEAFGTMAVVTAISQGARMLSDLGVRGSIIQHERGNEALFLDTAWVTQILRGAFIGVALWAASGVAQQYYEIDGLAWLIRAVAITAVVEGFTSTAVYTLVRRVAPGRQLARELVGQVVGIVAMIALASVWRSVWALAIGTIVTSVTNLVTSHFLIPGYRNRFRYDASAARDLRSYGRWILVSSAMTLVVTNADRLVLGKLVGARTLGVYAIALGVAMVLPEMMQAVASSVLMPVYARLKALPLLEQRSEIARHRLRVLGVGLPGIWLLAAIAPWLMSTLYDERYADAGWMASVLAAGAAATVICTSADRVFLSRGDSWRHMWVQVSQAALLILGMMLGNALAPGIEGVLYGVVGARVAGYAPLAIAMRKHGLWLPKLDFAAFASSAVACGVAIAWGRS